jgi:hypothetical protein
VARTQAVYYRDTRGHEPVREFVDALPVKRAAKIDDYVEEHLNGQPPDAPPAEFPVSSQIDAGCASCESASRAPDTGFCISGQAT